METISIDEAVSQGRIAITQDENLRFWVIDSDFEKILGFDYLPLRTNIKISFDGENKITAVFF